MGLRERSNVRARLTNVMRRPGTASLSGQLSDDAGVLWRGPQRSEDTRPHRPRIPPHPGQHSSEAQQRCRCWLCPRVSSRPGHPSPNLSRAHLIDPDEQTPTATSSPFANPAGFLAREISIGSRRRIRLLPQEGRLCGRCGGSRLRIGSDFGLGAGLTLRLTGSPRGPQRGRDDFSSGGVGLVVAQECLGIQREELKEKPLPPS
jgi:hypothetical protein